LYKNFRLGTLAHVSKIGFERARLQSCRKKPKLAAALAAEGCFSPPLSPFLKQALDMRCTGSYYRSGEIQEPKPRHPAEPLEVKTKIPFKPRPVSGYAFSAQGHRLTAADQK
jgi:hypothetical protein